MKFKINLFYLIIIASSLQFIGCTEKIVLVEDSISEYKIFLSDEASPSEKFAAEELQKYIYQISNCRLPITNYYLKTDKCIYLGFKGIPSSFLKNYDLNTFGSEEYIIESSDQGIIIAGGSKRGTLYGVIGFLSDYLGCRWYTPDFNVVPQNENIILPVIKKREKPVFEYREAWYNEAYDAEWAVHNRLNPSIESPSDSLGGGYKIYPFVHTFYQLVEPDKYFKKHPEYFSIVDGERKGDEAQLCLTNPNVVKIAINTVYRWIEEHPDVVLFSVDQNDGYGFCECENCKTIDELEGSHSGSILHFVNQIADTVAKTNPGIRLQTLAYAYSEIPPKNIKPHPIVTIRLCHYNYCSAHSLEGCDDHKVFITRLQEWSKISDRITIWDYFTDFNHYLLPFPNFESLKNDVKFYAENNCIGLFAQGGNVANNGGGEFASLRAWVFARLMWNPYQDAQLLIDEFITNVYGGSAPFINSYVNMLHEKVKPDSVYFSIYSNPSDGGYLTPDIVKESADLFEKAEKAASNDDELFKRVELASLPILYTQLYFYSIGGNAYLDAEEMPRVLKKFERIISENDIVQLAERREDDIINKFIQSIKSQHEYLTDWWIIGPFDNPSKNGLNTNYPPEVEFDTTNTFEGRNSRVVKWNHIIKNESGYMDFTKMFKETDIGIAYARSTINMKQDSRIKIGVGSNDGVRMWINGKIVLTNQIERKAEPNQDIVTVNLKKGRNSILLKIDQTGGGWGFYFTILEGNQLTI